MYLNRLDNTHRQFWACKWDMTPSHSSCRPLKTKYPATSNCPSHSSSARETEDRQPNVRLDSVAYYWNSRFVKFF